MFKILHKILDKIFLLLVALFAIGLSTDYFKFNLNSNEDESTIFIGNTDLESDAYWLIVDGLRKFNEGQTDAAITYIEKAISIYQQKNNKDGEAKAVALLGMI